MDRRTIEHQLRQVEDHLSLRERMVARQRVLVAELARDGHDTHVAMMRLIEIERSLEMSCSDRDRLRAELGKASY
jgi:hypothetical protein